MDCCNYCWELYRLANLLSLQHHFVHRSYRTMVEIWLVCVVCMFVCHHGSNVWSQGGYSMGHQIHLQLFGTALAFFANVWMKFVGTNSRYSCSHCTNHSWCVPVCNQRNHNCMSNLYSLSPAVFVSLLLIYVCGQLVLDTINSLSVPIRHPTRNDSMSVYVRTCGHVCDQHRFV